MYLLLKLMVFHCYVSLQEGRCCLMCCCFFCAKDKHHRHLTLHCYVVSDCASGCEGVWRFQRWKTISACVLFFWGEISMNNAEYVQRLFVTFFVKNTWCWHCFELLFVETVRRCHFVRILVFSKSISQINMPLAEKRNFPVH